MAAYNKFNNFVQALCDKVIDVFGTTEVWKAVIHTTAPSLTADTVYSNIVGELGNSNGYVTGGLDIGFNSTRTTDTITATATDVTWTASGGSLGTSTTGRYFSIYDFTAATKYLMCNFDYGATFTVASGETMTLDFSPTSLWTLV